MFNDESSVEGAVALDALIALTLIGLMAPVVAAATVLSLRVEDRALARREIGAQLSYAMVAPSLGASPHLLSRGQISISNATAIAGADDPVRLCRLLVSLSARGRTYRAETFEFCPPGSR